MGGAALTGGPDARRRGRARIALVVGVACVALAPLHLAAQAHPGGRWMTLETAHFRIHVRPTEERLGERVAFEAETAWSALAAHLPPPRASVDLVVADNVDLTNGLTSVFPSPVIIVYPVPPTADVELQRYDRWLRLVVTHELAHVFHLDLARGWWRVGRAVFGRSPLFFPNLFLPTWLVEGLAVHYESALTGAGRDRGSFHPAVLAAQAAERGALTIDAANGASPRWPSGARPYAFGASFLAELTRRDGSDVVDRLAVETAQQPLPYLLLGRSVRRAAGESATAAWRRWQDGLVAAQRDGARIGPAGGADESAPVAPGPGATRGLRSLVAPRVSPGGREVLFVRDDGRDEARLAVLDRCTGAVRFLARTNEAFGVAWDTGGGVLASEVEFTDPYTLRAGLVRVDAQGRERRLAGGARLLAPDVGPDGSVVAVRVDAGQHALVRWHAGATTILVPPQEGVEWAQPRVSPDGTRIAATRAVDGALDIVLLSAEGRVLRAVTADAAVDQMPAFSPDGEWLFWASDRSGRSEIYATRLADAASPWWRVTAEPFGAYAPAPAADSIYYLAYHSDGWRLSAAPLDTAAWTRLPPAETAATVVARAVPPDSAPTSGIVARHPYRPWPALLPHYWIPVGAAQGRSAWAGAYTSGADALGRHAYAMEAMVGTGNAAGAWRADLAYGYAGLAPLRLDAAASRAEEAFVARLAPPDTGVAEACCLRTDEASLGITVPFQRYRSAAAVRLAGEYQDEWGVARAGAVVSAAWTTRVEPAFAISAQKGWELGAAVRRRWRLATSGGYTDARLRGSAFLSLGVTGFARQVVAVHGAVGVLSGPDSVFFGAGGVSGGAVALVPGYAAGSSSREFPVRGFDPGSAAGRGAAAGSIEWRLPLALVGRGLGLVPGSLDRLSTAVFADGAVLWSPASWTARFGWLPRRATLASAGVELAADLGVLYDYPVRIRLGVARRLRPLPGAAAYAVVGAAF